MDGTVISLVAPGTEQAFARATEYLIGKTRSYRWLDSIGDLPTSGVAGLIYDEWEVGSPHESVRGVLLD